jgi:flagellin-specific chaperone FliS
LPRIDILLGAFDAVLNGIEQLAGLQLRDTPPARALRARCMAILATLAVGTDDTGGDLAVTLRRLYEFATHCLADGALDKIQAAERVLHTLREAFQGVRADAVQREHAGQIPALGQTWAVQVSA